MSFWIILQSGMAITAMQKIYFFLCASKKVTGYIASHTVPNTFFIMRKEYSTQYRKEVLYKICQIVKATGASHDRVQSALMRTDFKNSDTKAVTPDEFLKIVL